ncbi:LacI family DNA-binding transcriptional regulator [Maritimibacter dapengensis]|nr:LacI family DNA-binding transcriptional regulator [Maritimibacter dapengensis]
MPKPTYSDIAARASVGTATVERVLNGRGGVREVLVEQVVRAARALDWPGRLPERHRGILRVDVLLVRPESSFFARLAAAFRRIGATLDPVVQLHVTFLDENDPEAIAARIAKPSMRRAGLILAVQDAAPVRAALAQVRAEGTPVVQVVTRAEAETDFVGIDNYAAGRMAGLMMARLGAVRGPVVALCHSHVYEVHRARIKGFSEYLAGQGGTVDFVHVAYGLDNRDVSARRMREVLAHWPDLAGIYNAGGANTAVLDVLAHAGREVFFVGHELTDLTRGALETGLANVIFDQLPEAQARRGIDVMLAALGLLDEAVDNAPIRFSTITAENL